FSLGFEGGAKLGLMTIGGEIGYLMGDFGTAQKDGADARHNGQPISLDFSGTYLKVIVGVGI
ncbi:hypothetical protein, partial [Staphylococcus aureus]|uniref:hypothetical protein n=1 Tax=Staphylococcus aureus TaxID=1280 RepID=UPI0039BE05FC